MCVPLPKSLGHSALRSARLHFPNRHSVVARPCVAFRGLGVSQFVSMLLLTVAVVLTVYFGVAAWRLSDEKNIDITGQIAHQSFGWKGSPAK